MMKKMEVSEKSWGYTPSSHPNFHTAIGARPRRRGQGVQGLGGEADRRPAEVGEHRWGADGYISQYNPLYTYTVYIYIDIYILIYIYIILGYILLYYIILYYIWIVSVYGIEYCGIRYIWLPFYAKKDREKCPRF